MQNDKFLDRILEAPTYPLSQRDEVYVPTREELKAEIFKRLNIFQNKKYWIAFFSVSSTLILLIPGLIFLFKFFELKILFVALCYTMIIKNIHCTAYQHRFASHRSFTIKNKFWKFLFRNATIAQIPVEVYAISHLVHHAKSEKPGDPYNVLCGWAYCFFAEIIHNPISHSLNQKDYEQTSKLLSHTGMRLNSFKEYQKWGTISHPLYLTLGYLANWTFWFAFFFLLFGNIAYPLAIFGMTGLWSISIRNFNFKGHGGGINKQIEGRDFHKADMSVNIPLAGYAAGEWHNNHHLYPTSSRNDFLPNQIDLTFYCIKGFHHLGVVPSFIDKKKDFIYNHYQKTALKERLV